MTHDRQRLNYVTHAIPLSRFGDFHAIEGGAAAGRQPELRERPDQGSFAATAFALIWTGEAARGPRMSLME